MRERARLLALLLAAGTPASAGLLTGQGAAVTDQSGAQRATFSSNESIGFQVVVNNGVESANRISFQFSVVAPNGNTVFRHVGNSVRGTVGNAASAVTGVPIAGFYQGPGQYTLKAVAGLDGVSVEQDQGFTVSSPNILLIYPPNGVRGLTDNPLTFQWYSSGAATYRVTVGDSASLYNALFVQNSAPGANTLTYPQNPTDARQRLSSGQTYWWKVEGLDLNGNVVAQSQVPFSFSVAETALARDLAVTVLELTGGPAADGTLPFRITVKNQGNTTERNIPLRMTLGGLSAPNSPMSVPQLSPGEEKGFDSPVAMPSDQNQSLAIACLTIFDDNVANNCKTLSVNRPAAASTAAAAGALPPLSSEQIWEAVRQLMKEKGIDLDDYDLVNVEGSLSRDELSALLDQLRSGQAQANLSGSPLASDGAAVPVAPAPSAPAAPDEPEALPPAPPEPQAQAPEPLEALQKWSGDTPPLSSKDATFSVVNDPTWKRLWRRLSMAAAPDIDFSRYMVVGVIAGSASGVDRVEIDGLQPTSATLEIRYRLVRYARPYAVNQPKDAPRGTAVPYLLEAVARTTLKVKFVPSKEEHDDAK